MSEPVTSEEGREEVDQRTESGTGSGSGRGKRDSPDAAGAKRDSDASSGSEGSQQQRQTQALQNQPSGQGGKSQGQGQSADEGIEKEAEKTQVKRHVEASPQGRYLRFEDKLGTGQYKVVYRSYDTSMGIEVAWNTVNIKNLPKEEKKRIMNEVRLLQNLEHKNLVQFHGSWVNREREEVIFVTEIMQSGSLMDFIRKVEMIRWRVVKRWARQILRGMHYLHSQDPPIIHRDLKCDNIFINGAAGDIRIGDLGLSTSNTRSEKTMSVLGTPEFMAPELYEEFYTEKVDIYAFGMCMLEMVTKERPYSECVNAAQIYRKVTSQILPSALDRVQNARARDFIRRCLSPDPDDRPSAMDLLDLPFLKDKNEEEDNTLVMLDPLVAEATGQVIDPVAVAGVLPGVGVNAPAKIDPSLPGVSHPAQRGTPGLDTIQESVVGAGGQAGAPQAPAPNAGTLQTPASGAAGAPALDEADAGRDSPTRKPSYAAALMSDSVGSESGEIANGTSSGADGGHAEQREDQKSVDFTPAQPGSGTREEGGDAPVAEAEEAQYGVHKIPGNPPFESEDDEDEQENDISHPEGFLRAMPEDESAMRVLKLPDGRVQRVEDDDEEEEEEDASADDAESVTVAQTAPSSAQAPPLASGAPADAVVEALMPVPAEQPPPPAASPTVQAPRPPTVDSSIFYSGGGHRASSSATAETSSVTMTGSSTSGSSVPPGVAVSAAGMEPAFPFVGGAADPAAAAQMTGLASDPGLARLAVGPALPLQRARSFSPLEHALEAPNIPAPSPMAPAPMRPAPSFPAPRPPGANVHFVGPLAKAHGSKSPDVVGNGNGPGAAGLVGNEGKRLPHTAQADLELQELLSGRAAGLGGFKTEIKIANLQGPEQEIMKLVMHTPIEGRLQEVEFEFNLDHDHPKQVSAEMIRELDLSDDELGQISLTITTLAEKARKRRVRRGSSGNSGVIAGQTFDSNVGPSLPWAGNDTNLDAGTHRGSQGSGGTASFGSCGGGDGPISGGSEGADNDITAVGGIEEFWSDDDVDIEEDDEFRKRKLLHDKKKRQAEKVYESRLAALLAARSNRNDEHKRAQERYKKDCDDFDKKVEKLKSEKGRRMEECLDELRGLENGYRQKHRDAKQAKRHGVSPGNIVAQVGLMSVAQPPLEAAPTPQGYAQRQALGHGQGHNQGLGLNGLNDGAGQVHGQGQSLMDQARPRNETDAGADETGGSSDHQPMNLSLYNSSEGHVGGNQWSSNSHEVAVATAMQQGANPPTTEEEEAARRDRISTL